MNVTTSDSVAINWRPNLKDAYSSLRLGFWGTPARITRTVIMLFVFPTLVFGWLINLATGSRLSFSDLTGIAMTCGLAWGVLFGLSFGAWLARFIVKTQRAKGDPQQIIVGPETIERVLKDSKITYPWSAIRTIEEAGPAFILIGSSGPITSIEKSGINSNAELQALRSFLRAKRPGKYLDDEST